MGKIKSGLAYYDTLTGLPKMNLLKNKLNHYIITSDSDKAISTDKLALVYLDINHFQYMNDAFGDKAAKEIVKNLADYFTNNESKIDYVARVAEDKFAVLLTGIKSHQELYESVDEIINGSSTIDTSSNVFHVTMSAGIALYPEHGNDIDSLMKKAESAIYFAKRSGEDIYIYNDELQKDIVNRVQMINELQAAITKEKLTLYYQPQYDINTSQMIGVEALVRWPYQNRYISPEIFIPIAEESKQIYELERWIINKALKQKKQWEKEGFEDLEVSINLSNKTIESESNFQRFMNILSAYHIDYSGIIFEITENAIITQVDVVKERLDRLRALGIRIALDDFGTGYSSLTHVMKLPINFIKIDKSFIKSIPEGLDETIITQNILSMAHDLNFTVVAEGIETQEQLDYLKKLSCERGQGFYLCEPLPIDQLEEVLRRKTL